MRWQLKNIYSYWTVLSGLGAIALIGGLIYSNTLHAPFVFDDLSSIVHNVVRQKAGLSPSAWWSAYPARLLTYATFNVNYARGGLEVFGYHATNIAIHILAAWAVYGFAYELARQVWPPRQYRWGQLAVSRAVVLATVAGMLFVVHPLQTQAVTYVVQRLASLAGLLYATTLWLYLRGRRQGNQWELVGSWLVALLAMHAKETAFTLPVALVLVEFARGQPDGRRWWLPILRLWPWLLLLIIIPLYRLQLHEWVLGLRPGNEVVQRLTTEAGRQLVVSDTQTVGRREYLLTQINVVRTYWRLVVWPVNQNLDYDYRLVASLWNAPTILSAVLHVVILGAAASLWWRPAARALAIGIVLFYLGLAVESSLFPIPDVIFEHRVYLPFIGVAVAFGALIVMLVDYLGERGRQSLLGALGVGLVLLAVVLSIATWRRNWVWADEIRLWTDVAEKSPQKSRPHNNLGIAYLREGQPEVAKEHYQQELTLDPKSVSGHVNLASIYGQQGHYDIALKHVQQALALQPESASAHNNLGNIYRAQHKLPEAVAAYRQSLTYAALDDDVWVNLGDVLVDSNDFPGAREAYARAVTLDPNNAEWRNKLGATLGALKEYPLAREQLEQGIALDPNYGPLYSNLGHVLRSEGNLLAAISQYERYLQYQPRDSKTMVILADMYVAVGDVAQAQRLYRSVLQLEPGNERVRQQLRALQG